MEAPEGMTGVRGGTIGKIRWVVTRAPVMGGNAYVKVPEDHPWYDKDYDTLDPYPDVHGGLTYADGAWVGFDTAHSGDYWSQAAVEELGPPLHDEPYYSFYKDNPSNAEIHWTLDLLVKEVRSLASQANKIYKDAAK